MTPINPSFEERLSPILRSAYSVLSYSTIPSVATAYLCYSLGMGFLITFRVACIFVPSSLAALKLSFTRQENLDPSLTKTCTMIFLSIALMTEPHLFTAHWMIRSVYWLTPRLLLFTNSVLLLNSLAERPDSPPPYEEASAAQRNP